MKKKFIKKLIIILILIALSANSLINAKPAKKALTGVAPKTNFILEFMLGYGFPVNSSYIDTYVNQDYFWNPNSGITADLRFTVKLHENVFLTLPIAVSFGIYQYTTTDGRKVNTEAAAGRAPGTTNTEWAFSHDFVPMIYAFPAKHPAVPYIGIGLGLNILWSFETWEFTNVDDAKVKLVIAKYHLPNPSFKAEIGWFVPITKKFYFRVAGFFNLVNSIMVRVDLTNYYIDGEDRISEYDEKSRIYNYSFNSPDENKGGACLLAGFNYENYPQQKIGTTAGIKVGFAYNF